MSEQVSFDLSINLDSLEKDFQSQVTMIEAATKRLAVLRRKHTEAKNNVELVEAQLKRDIRKNPSQHGVPDGKITEGSVNEAMVVNPKYQEALTSLNESKYRLDIVEGIVQSLEHRKRALEKECDLWANSYFSRPKAPDTLPEVRDAARVAERRTVRTKGTPIVKPK